MTTFAGGYYGANGNMFDVKALGGNVTINRFDLNLFATAGTIVPVRAYYKTGSYSGYEATSSAWTLLGTYSVTSAGLGSPSSMPVSNLLLTIGQTYGIYLTTTDGTAFIYTGSANTYSNANLQVTLGAGVYYPFGAVYIAVSPRTWNGTIYYTVGGTSATVPGAPTIGTATAGNAQATVTFTAPGSNGGSAITGYTVISNPAGGVDSNAGTTGLSHVITGLTNGTAYTFTVTATNSVGTGPASAASNSVTPATVPGAPAIGTATAGNTQATVTFTTPASNGGSAITGYTVTCLSGPVTATRAASPITVTGLTNGTLYSCLVTATNAAGTSAPSATVSVTPTAPTPIALVAVQSRKVHGATGTYDIPIDSTIAIGGLVSVEPRAIGTGHVIVFQFNVPITVAGTVAVVDALAAPVGTPSALASGNEVLVTVTGVPDNKRVTVTLTGVNGTLTTSASMGFLVGDVNNSRSVTATDILQVKGRSGQVTDATNFKFDLNASGSITASDILAVKGRSGLVLP
jgi:hypothetical protein